MEGILNINEDTNKLLETIKKIKINISIPSSAPVSDRGLHNLLIEGTKENDLKKIYNFVESVEMGCGFYSNEIAKLSKIYDRVIETNQNQVIEILNSNRDIIYIVYNCYCIQEKLKVKLLESHEITNGFLIFELIRQLLNYTKFGESNSSILEDKNIISFGIERLALIDSSLYQYLIEKFEYNEDFQMSLGIALGNMGTSGRQMYAKTITIAEQYTSIFQYIRESKYDSFITDVKEIICQRWEDHLSSLLINKKFVQNIVINPYSDLIFNCLCKKYEDEELFFLDLETIIIQFDEAIYKWYRKGTEFTSIYNIYATKLYFLKKVQLVNKISLADKGAIYDKMKDLFDNNYMIHNNHIIVDDLILDLDILN